MKNVVLLLNILLVICFTFSCSPKKGKKLATTTIEEEPVSIFTPPAEEAEPKPEIIEDPVVEEPEIEKPIAPYLIASLKKTPCYGKCPVFEAKVYSDGKITYIGTQHVDKIGFYETHVDDQFINNLFAKAGQINYLNLNSNYPTNGKNISDVPSTISYLKIDADEKTIFNNFDSPIALRHYEKYFVNLLSELDWRKVD